MNGIQLYSAFAVLASLIVSVTADTTQSGCGASKQPKNYGIILSRAFDVQDVFGPIEALQLLAHNYTLNLALLYDTLDPVTTEPVMASMNPKNSSFWPSAIPTHTFDSNPDLDVLIVPGGLGARSPNVTTITDYIARTYPSVQYLIVICTGGAFAAKSGVLDGKRATTNKRSWATITAMGPKVKWVPRARWVVDGNVWTSSGVTAGLDVIIAFIKATYGDDVGDNIALGMEYEPHPADWDPFGEYYNTTVPDATAST